jgi:hypothetical protein
MKRVTLGSICLLVLIMLASAGCYSTVWRHSDPSRDNPAQFSQDKYVCEGEAYRRAALLGYAGNAFAILNEMKKCMRYKGWHEEREGGFQEQINTGTPGKFREKMSTGPPGK